MIVNEKPLPLVLYGIGKYGKRIFEILKKNQIIVTAICVDPKFFKEDFTNWDGLPVYNVENIYEKFEHFNIVIGIYDILTASRLRIEGVEDIYFWHNKRKLVSVKDLPLIEKKMTHFFKNDPNALKIKNALQLYFECQQGSVEFLNYNVANDTVSFRTDEGLKIITDSYFSIFVETFCEKIYFRSKEILGSMEYILFDMGANRGYTTLYFSTDTRCKQIFSFEPDRETLKYFYQNLELNPVHSNKISVFEYGLLDSTKVISFFKASDGSDWANSFDQSLMKIILDSKRREKLQEIKLKVYNASEVIHKLIKENHISPHLKKVIKIDVEGSEYAILSNLKQSGLLSSFSLIFGECHNGIEDILTICKDNFNLVQLKREAGDVEGLCNFILLNKNDTI